MTELIKLSDYFQPLNPITFSYYLGLLIFFDVLGVSIFPKIKDRILHWLIGLGFFVFIWFILRFFIPPHRPYLVISILIFSAICLPSYLKNKQHKKILKTLKNLKIPLLIILPFLPAVFVKASLPPYYSDEMAYQFISPSQLADLGTWHFVAKFYQNLPRVFNYFYTLIFSLTKTYSPARLFHFSVLLTAFLFVYQRLKSFIGFLPAFLFVFIFFSLPQNIVQAATIGFVDVATYSFLLIAVAAAALASSLTISAIFWGMSLGTKYTPLTAFASFLISLTLVYRPKLTFKKIIKLIVIMLIFGGYWYLKNLIVFGNPTYPLFFKCYRYTEICNFSTEFFTSWTTAINLTNLPSIFTSLLPANPFLLPALALSPVLILLNKNTKLKKISWFLIFLIVFELFFLKYTSGFYLRYHQHLQLLLILLIVVQLGNNYKNKAISLLAGLFYVCLFLTTAKSYLSTFRSVYTSSFLPQQQLNYSLGKININDWIKQNFPNVIEAIYWCQNPPQGRKIALVRLDPDMIWFKDEGYMRSFLTNCYVKEHPSLDGLPLSQVLTAAKHQKIKFYTVSINPCIPDQEVKIKRHEEIGDPRMIYLRRLNNTIVCNSQQIKHNLYYFDYEKIK